MSNETIALREKIKELEEQLEMEMRIVDTFLNPGFIDTNLSGNREQLHQLLMGLPPNFLPAISSLLLASLDNDIVTECHVGFKRAAGHKFNFAPEWSARVVFLAGERTVYGDDIYHLAYDLQNGK